MQPIELSLSCSFTTAVRPSQRVCEVASMFGLGVDESRTIAVVPPMTLPVAPGSVIFITGASGGGKSTLLRLIGEQLRGREEVRVVEFGRGRETDPGQGASGMDAMAGLGEHRSIVEAIGGPGATLEQAVRWLALAGLNDAFVMLRTVSELSDGQRYRFALARAMAETEGMSDVECGMSDVQTRTSTSNIAHSTSNITTVVLADEFGSTLDRLTAKIVARNVRKWVRRQRRSGGVCFIAATTHDDLLEYLEPDVLVVQEPGEGVAVHCRESAAV